MPLYGPRKQAFPSGYDGPIVHSCSQSKPDSEFALPDRCLSETSWSCQRLPFFAKTPNKPKNHCKSFIGQSHQDGNAKRFASAPTKLFTGGTSLESVYKDLSVAGSLPSFKIWWLCIFPLFGSEKSNTLGSCLLMGVWFFLDKIERVHLHCRSFGTIILF